MNHHSTNTTFRYIYDTSLIRDISRNNYTARTNVGKVLHRAGGGGVWSLSLGTLNEDADWPVQPGK